jgi:hypothetical protein
MTKIEVWTRLQGDDEFLLQCLLILYQLQTDYEQISKSTTETNRVGFNKGDASFLGEMAVKVKSSLRDYNWPKVVELVNLNFSNITLTREKMLKYSQQLANIFTANDGDVA